MLFAKRVALERLEPERPYSFWVDAHGRLEISEITLPPGATTGQSRHCVTMTARDAHGATRVEKATIFDSGAYFNVEALPNARASVVKGGLAWSFPGPAMYEFVNARAPGGPPPTPLPLKLRMVTRYEVDEQLSEREAKEHPLVAAPRRAPPAVFASTIGGGSGGGGGGQLMKSGGASGAPSRAYEAHAHAAYEGRPMNDRPAPNGFPLPSGGGTKYDGPGGSYVTTFEGTAPRSVTAWGEAPPSTSGYGGLGGGVSRPGTADPLSLDPYRAGHPPANPSSVYLSCDPSSRGGGGASRPVSTSQGLSAAPGSGSLGMASLDRAFDKFDRDGSGYLSMKEVAAALRSLGMEVTPKTLAHFADADADGDGALRLGEFRSLVATLEAEAQKEGGAPLGGGDGGGGGGGGAGGGAGGGNVDVAELMEAKVIFDRHDRDRNGFLATRELRHALKDLHLQADSAQAISVLHEFDRDSDGRLDLAEFAKLLRKLRSLQGVAPTAAVASLRAAFRAYDTRGVGTIPVADVRPALMRGGVDTSSGVAVAIFAALQDQPRTHLDFSQFQRIAHAITSAGSSAGAGAGGLGLGAAAAAGPGAGLPATYSPSKQMQPVPAAYPYGRSSTAAASSYPPPMGGQVPPTAAPSYSSGGGYSAYPPGYQPTELGGPRPPSYSPARASASLSRGATPPDGRGAVGRDEARRLARKPHTPAHAAGSAAAAADPYALVPPSQRPGAARRL